MYYIRFRKTYLDPESGFNVSHFLVLLIKNTTFEEIGPKRKNHLQSIIQNKQFYVPSNINIYTN